LNLLGSEMTMPKKPMQPIAIKPAKIAAQKLITKPKVSKSAAVRPASQSKKEDFHTINDGGIAVPFSMIGIVPVSKLEAGLEKAQIEALKLVRSFSKFATAEYTVKEIEVSLSFDANGKFLGIGIGGAASVKMKLSPKQSD